jgi:hypothetical protein
MERVLLSKLAAKDQKLRTSKVACMSFNTATLFLRATCLDLHALRPRAQVQWRTLLAPETHQDLLRSNVGKAGASRAPGYYTVKFELINYQQNKWM